MTAHTQQPRGRQPIISGLRRWTAAAALPANTVGALVPSALAWFVPATLHRDRDRYSRARMFVLGHLFGPPLGLVLLLYLYRLDPSPGAHWWIVTGSVIAFFGFPFALRWTGRLELLSYITVQHFVFVILFGSYFYGGVSSPFLCWLLTVPLYALFYLGASRWLRWSLLTCLGLYLAAWYAFQVGGHSPPERIPLADLSGVGILSIFCATAFVSLMSLYYARIVASTRQVHELNAELERRVRGRTRELEQTRHEVIDRLATAGEFRDSDTGRHVLRISHYAYHLALAAGASEIDAAMIRDAAPLHDIGKIGIPDAILLKPGRLDPAEWELMKRHTVIGGEILAGSDFPLLELAREIALSHHEHWDGGGYPRGLRGEAIPFAGRVVAIADVFDATTSDRPYKPAWSAEQAIGFMRERAGRQFDPRLMQVFERELPHILEIKRRFEDPVVPRRAQAAGPPRPYLIRSG